MSQAPQQMPIPAYVLSILAEMKDLFGPPPVLSTENAEAYHRMLLCLVEQYEPHDLVGQMLVKQVLDSMWDIQRITRHMTLAIDRKFRDLQKFQAQGRKAAAQKKEALAKRLAQSKAEPPTVPEEVTDGLVEEVDAILQEPATELDHARALEAAIAYYERLDKSRMMAIAMRTNALNQLEQLRQARNDWMDRESLRSRRQSDRPRTAKEEAAAWVAERLDRALGIVPPGSSSE
jgi:hypothetical protein